MIQCVCDNCGKTLPCHTPILRLTIVDPRKQEKMEALGISPPGGWTTRAATDLEETIKVAPQNVVLACSKKCAEEIDDKTP